MGLLTVRCYEHESHGLISHFQKRENTLAEKTQRKPKICHPEKPVTNAEVSGIFPKTAEKLTQAKVIVIQNAKIQEYAVCRIIAQGNSGVT